MIRVFQYGILLALVAAFCAAAPMRSAIAGARAPAIAGHVVDAVGESPVWRASEGALYWTDIPARRIYRLVRCGRKHIFAQTANAL